MNKEEKKNDKLLENRLRWKWVTKYRMLRALKESIFIAEQGLEVDRRLLEESREEIKKRQKQLTTSTDSQSNSKHGFIKKRECELERLMNFIGFIDLNSIDISILSYQMIKDRNRWSRNFYARLAFTLMYELTEDICQFLGNDKSKETGQEFGIRPIVQDMSDADLTNKLNTTARQWNNFKNSIRESDCDYHFIRNVATAHRDHDFSKLQNAMINVSWSSAFLGLHEFNNNMTVLRNFIGSLTSKYFRYYLKGLDAIAEN